MSQHTADTILTYKNRQYRLIPVPESASDSCYGCCMQRPGDLIACALDQAPMPNGDTRPCIRYEGLSDSSRYYLLVPADPDDLPI